MTNRKEWVEDSDFVIFSIFVLSFTSYSFSFVYCFLYFFFVVEEEESIFAFSLTSNGWEWVLSSLQWHERRSTKLNVWLSAKIIKKSIFIHSIRCIAGDSQCNWIHFLQRNKFSFCVDDFFFAFWQINPRQRQQFPEWLKLTAIR